MAVPFNPREFLAVLLGGGLGDCAGAWLLSFSE